MKQYLDLVQHVYRHGVKKPTRAKLESTGQKISAYSVFGYQTRFDLREGFPATTTKKLAFKTMVHELLWFLRGSTNAKELQAENVHIWDQWANAETGDVGPVYGYQWRSWPDPPDGSIDQIEQLIEGIEAVKKDPTASVGRRLIVSAWNPADLPRMGLPPCHALFQFSVTEGRLSCGLYQRSADAFLGVPFNIASYALLTHMIAQVTGLEAGEFIHSFGDLHIYENHIEQCEELFRRSPLPLPRLVLNKDVKSLFDFRATDVFLADYQNHGQLKGEVAV